MGKSEEWGDINQLKYWDKGSNQESEYLLFEGLFKNFEEAFAFLTQVALISQKLNHHGEIFNLSNSVIIRLNTSSQVTQLDVDMAKEIEIVANTYLG